MEAYGLSGFLLDTEPGWSWIAVVVAFQNVLVTGEEVWIHGQLEDLT